MSHIDERNERLALKLIKNLQRRHMEAFYCKTPQEAIDKVLQLIPAGSQVTWGGSATIRDMGLTKAIHECGKYNVLDRDTAPDRETALRMYVEAFGSDYYLSSVNAISEDGVIVNIDGNGNRVAAITFGPKHVIFVVGLHKVCQDVDAALKRARSTASPINAARFDIKTPCHQDGVCHNCNSADCICNYIHFLRNSPGGKHQVILLPDALGY